MEERRSKRVSDRELSLAVTGKPDFMRFLRDGRAGDPSAAKLLKLAKVMGVGPHYFIDGEASTLSAPDDLDLIKLAFRAADRQMAEYRGSLPEEFRADLAAAIYDALRQHQAQGRTIDADIVIGLVTAVFGVAAKYLKTR
jgi:hypothetical protein